MERRAASGMTDTPHYRQLTVHPTHSPVLAGFEIESDPRAQPNLPKKCAAGV